MPYQRTTLATLRTRLQERWESVPFWSNEEARWALNEALRKWNLFTAQWKRTITITTVPDQVWYSINEADLRDGLIDYWPMEEVTGTDPRLDVLGQNPFMPSGTVTQVVGKHLFAAQVAPDDTLTTQSNVDWTKPWSVETWFSYEDDTTNIDVVSATGWTMKLTKNSNNVLRLTTTLGFHQSPVVLVPGQFYHIIITNDGFGQFFVYLDGAVTISHHDDTPPVAGKLVLKGPVVAESPVGSATYDEVAFYDVAMPAGQVVSSWNNGQGLFFGNVGGTLLYPLRMEFQSYPMTACAIEDMDAFRVYWQNEYVGWARGTPPRPMFFVPAGLTLFAIWPQDHIGGSKITIDAVVHTPILVQDSDFVDLGEEEMHALLGEALSIASFKEGGLRWKACQRFHQEFLQSAMEKNKRFKASFLLRRYAGLDTARSSKPLNPENLSPVGARNG